MNGLENNNTLDSSKKINDGQYINNASNNNQTPKLKKVKKNNTKTGALVVILIILILALIGVITIKVIYDSQNQFKVLVTNTFGYLENNIQNYSKSTGTFSLKLNVSSSDKDVNELLKVFDKFDLEGEYGVDFDNKLMFLDLKSKYDNDKLINCNLYIEDRMSYTYLEDIYDKQIKSDLGETKDLFNKTNINDYKVILNSVYNAVTKALKDDYFETSRVTMDGKKLTKTVLNINAKNYETINKDILNILLGDSNFLKSVSNVTSKTEDEIKKNIYDRLDAKFNGNDSTITLYTNNYKFYKLECKSKDSLIEITKEGEDTYNYNIVSGSSTTTNYETSSSDNISGTVKISKENNNKVVSFSLTDENGFSYKMTLKTSVQYGKDVSKRNIESSINKEDLTDEDISNIYSNLLDQKGISNLLSEIYKIYGFSFNLDNDSYIDDSYIDSSYNDDFHL